MQKVSLEHNNKRQHHIHSTYLQHVPGILYQGAAGRIDMPETSAPWGPKTLSWIASMTKLATAVSLLQIVEKGLVNLDQDLRPQLPFLAHVQIIRGIDPATRQPRLEPNTTAITLRHLLTHTVGLAYDLNDELLMQWRRAVGKDRVNMTWTDEGFATPLLFAPGADWQYGTGLDWAGLLLERLTGQRLSAYMAAHVFAPLDMRETGFWPERIAAGALAAVPYRMPGGELAGAPSPVPAEHPVESGGAGIFTTVVDYGKLLRGVLDGGKLLLGRESWELLFTPRLSGDLEANMRAKVKAAQAVYAAEFLGADVPTNFAFGGMVNLADVPGKRSKGSVQWSGYTNPHWWIDRETGVAAVLQVSLLPPGDPVVVKLYDALERAVYADLLKGESGHL